MSTTTPASPAAPPSATLTVFRLASLFTFLAVAMGAVVCATGSGASCPTWPGCRPDTIAPQWELSPVIEFTHRVGAIGAGPFVLAAAVLSLRLHRPVRWVRVMPWVALVGAVAAGVFGRMVVVGHLPTALGAVDLFSALTAMTVIGTSTIVLGRVPVRPDTDAAGPDDGGPSPHRLRPTAGEPAVPLAAASVVAVVALHVTGIFAAGTGSYTRCLGWPLWRTIGSDLHPWLQYTRLGLAGVAAALVVATAAVAVRSDRLRGWGVAVAALFAGELALGLVIRSGGLDQGVAAGYSVLAAALLWCLGLLGAVAWTLPARPPAGPDGPAHEIGEHLVASA